MKQDVSLMKSILGKNFTKRNRFTRQCIGESIIALMQNKLFEDITISDIVKKAGVSRMTFYHYFQSKTEALNSYLHEIIELYLEECNRSIGIETFYDAAHIRHAFLFFELYYYGGALLNVFLKWEAGGKQESVDEIVQVICHCSNIDS